MEEFCRLKMIRNPATIVRTDDPARWTAQKFVDCAREAIVERGIFRVALGGGSTPRRLYRLLASDEFRPDVDWTRVHFFFGDERNVASTDAESNFRSANDTLFEPLSIPDGQIHRWRAEIESPGQVADSYAHEIKVNFGIGDGEFPIFDLILLGMGDDGHTASLFPHTAALAENRKTAVENWVGKLGAWRFTLTFPTLNNARSLVCLVQGSSKAAMLQQVIEGPFVPEALPVQSLKPSAGTIFAVDHDAARLLTDQGL
jgi:6-phosphogluconolactonase